VRRIEVTTKSRVDGRIANLTGAEWIRRRMEWRAVSNEQQDEMEGIRRVGLRNRRKRNGPRNEDVRRLQNGENWTENRGQNGELEGRTMVRMLNGIESRRERNGAEYRVGLR
jgi:hypothetical protein